MKLPVLQALAQLNQQTTSVYIQMAILRYLETEEIPLTTRGNTGPSAAAIERDRQYTEGHPDDRRN